MPEQSSQRYKRDFGIEHTPLDQFNIDIAVHAAELEDAFSLLHHVYVDTGLQHTKKVTMRITPHHVLRESIIFVARKDAHSVGTITTTQDSPAGLPLDKDFPEAMTRLRKNGAKLAELGSLAILKENRRSGLNTLLCLIGFWASRRLFESVDTMVFGVHPKAEAYFWDTWGATRIGDPKRHWEFDAPVLGMSLDLRQLRQHLKKQFPLPMADGRGIDKHCCNLPGSYFVPTHSAMLLRKQRKISSSVFKEIFEKRSNRLHTLDSRTRRYMESQRSEALVMENVSCVLDRQGI